MSRLITGRSYIHRLFEEYVVPKSIADRLWFREAVTVDAKPMVLQLDSGTPVFLWELPSGQIELWGGYLWLDGVEFELNHADALNFLLNVPRPFVHWGWLNSPFPIPAIECVAPLERMTRHTLRDSSFEEFTNRCWSKDRVKKIRQEMKKFSSLSVEFVHEVDSRDFTFIVQKSTEVSRSGKYEQESTLLNPSVERGLWKVLNQAEAHDSLVTLRVKDGERIVACEFALHDKRTQTISSQYGYHDSEYKGLGKYLYELMLNYAFKTKARWISAGIGLIEVKKLYGYEALDSFYVELQ